MPNAKKLENLNDIKKDEALFIVASSWIIFGLISAIPYLFYGLSPLNSLFEAVSGITTTGATILTRFDYPKSFFFWRAFTQWLGGLGIIVLFIDSDASVESDEVVNVLNEIWVVLCA